LAVLVETAVSLARNGRRAVTLLALAEVIVVVLVVVAVAQCHPVSDPTVVMTVVEAVEAEVVQGKGPYFFGHVQV
jgi:hypothetical protein